MSRFRVEPGAVEQSIRGLRQEAERLGHCARALEREAAELEHTALAQRAQRLAEELREQRRELEELCTALHQAMTAYERTEAELICSVSALDARAENPPHPSTGKHSGAWPVPQPWRGCGVRGSLLRATRLRHEAWLERMAWAEE